MANDDETLTFRLRAVAENMAAFGKAARGTEEVNSAMIKSQKTAEALAVSNRKLTAARDKEADAAGRVRVAEEKLKAVRDNVNSKMTQIAAAEERVAAARRNSSRATNDANRIEADFKKVAEKALGRVAEASGQDAGHRFGFGWSRSLTDGSMDREAGKKSGIIGRIFGGGGLLAGRTFSVGFKKSSTGVADELEKSSSIVGRTFGTGILSGMEGILKSEAGPAFLAALVAVAAIAAPAIGAVLAGGIVFAFGAGLLGLGILFAAKTNEVKLAWKAATASMAADMKDIAKPLDGVLIHFFGSMQATLNRLAPVLRSVFGNSAGPVQKFFDDVLKAIERLTPALMPLSNAFNQLLGALGPGLQDAFRSIADGLIQVSNSVARNPTGLADFIRGLGNLLDLLLRSIAILNDANGAFERLTGGTSAVTVTMNALTAVVGAVLGPFLILAKYVTLISDAVRGAAPAVQDLGKQASLTGGAAGDMAAKVAGFTATAPAAGDAAAALAKKVKDAAKAAADAKTKFEDWITSLFKLQNLAATLAQAQLDVKQAMADAAAGITGNSAKIQAARDREANAVGRLRTAEAQLAALRSSGKATHAQMVAAEERLAAAKRAVASASDALTKATNANSTSIDENTQKGRDNHRNLVALSVKINAQTEATARSARAHGQLTDAMVKAGVGTVEMQKNAKTLSAGFVALAIKMGYPIPVAKAMAKTLIAIPNVTREAKLIADKRDLDTKLAAARRSLADPNLTRERKAKLNADIAVLQRKIRDAQRQIDALHGKTVEVKYQSFGVTTWSAVHTAHGVAATGKKIRGPGSGTSDSAGMFALSNNEWVIKAKSSQKYGDYAMASVNDGTATIIPGMAAGGPALVNLFKTGVFHSIGEGNAFFNKMFGASSAPGAGAGVQKWAPVALAALRAAGVPPSWLGSLLRRMNQESGGNPRAINLTDSNARAGDPSRGLMQTIGSTFNAYAGRFRSRGIYDPFANIYAAIQYTIARYGSGPAGWNRRGGYALGGKINSYRNGTPYVPYDGLAYLHRGERVTPASGSGGDIHIHLEGAIIGSQQQALDWLTKGIDTLKRQRRIA